MKGGKVRVIQAEDGALSLLVGHDDSITDISIAGQMDSSEPSKELLVTAAKDNTLIVWQGEKKPNSTGGSEMR